MKMVTLDTIGLTAFGYDFGCCEKLEYVGTFYVTLRETLRAQSENLISEYMYLMIPGCVFKF